ncbi:MAG: peptidoglycan editing factor PgeF [Sinobacterium sp.]|nr:peptidoglycan editing factor PgeF [Sinobacterium sp.]
MAVSSAVLAGVTDRLGGSSVGEFSSFNLALHVEDNAEHVALNRQYFAQHIHAAIEDFQWLNQVHGSHVFVADKTTTGFIPKADAVISRTPGVVCSVLTADCLPVLISNKAGTEVAAIHAGWRSLAAGIIEKTIDAMESSIDDLVVWFGPAIGPNQFEVGNDVKEAFAEHSSGKESLKAFTAIAEKEWKYLVDIYQLAEVRLANIGVASTHKPDYCTVEQSQWFSYRRDNKTGRMASFIMIK